MSTPRVISVPMLWTPSRLKPVRVMISFWSMQL